MTKADLWPLLKQTFTEYGEDKVQRMAAALAYYTAISLAPLLVLSVMVLGLFWSDSRGAVIDQLHKLMGGAGAQAATEMLDHAKQQGHGVIATIISIGVLLFGASGVFGELQDSLNTIWEVRPKPGLGIMELIRQRFLSLAMVFGVAFLLLVSLVVSSVLSIVVQHLPFLTGTGFFGHVIPFVLDLVVSVGVITLLFAAIFRFLPDVTIKWRDVWLGALLTALLFTMGKYLLGIYFAKASPASAYGAAGSLAALLIWVYYSSQILYFGAEFTQVYANEYGSHIVPAPHAEPLTQEMREQQGIVKNDPNAPASKMAARVEPKPVARPLVPAREFNDRGWAGVAKSASIVAGVLLGGFVLYKRTHTPAVVVIGSPAVQPRVEKSVVKKAGLMHRLLVGVVKLFVRMWMMIFPQRVAM